VGPGSPELTRTAHVDCTRPEHIQSSTRAGSPSGVRGLNGRTRDPLGSTPLTGERLTRHDGPNVGNHSVTLPLRYRPARFATTRLHIGFDGRDAADLAKFLGALWPVHRAFDALSPMAGTCQGAVVTAW
jgi:hypothetical protein